MINLLDLIAVGIIFWYFINEYNYLLTRKKISSSVHVYSRKMLLKTNKILNWVVSIYFLIMSILWCLFLFNLNHAIDKSYLSFVYPILLIIIISNESIICTIGEEGVAVKNRIYDWTKVQKVDLQTTGSKNKAISYIIHFTFNDTRKLDGYINEDSRATVLAFIKLNEIDYKIS
ncbi:hypothetical protein [Paenibacillus planticolens]|uniref:hypothetical protein n=1 Tax=Paenibacillus planticolens TaxID=2654976 RepID=UPI001492BCDB|nr:hypothetical protein [Paenibacillus planticolens]